MYQLALLISLLGMMAACQGSLSQETVLRVNPYRQPCQGESAMNCLLVQEGKQIGTGKWELFYEQIKGFRHEEGYSYTLKIKRKQISNPPSDGSAYRYTLLKVLSREKVR